MPIWRSRIVCAAEAEDGAAVLADLHAGISDSPQKAANTFLGNVPGEQPGWLRAADGQGEGQGQGKTGERHLSLGPAAGSCGRRGA
jgi:hypothetical protein